VWSLPILADALVALGLSLSAADPVEADDRSALPRPDEGTTTKGEGALGRGGTPVPAVPETRPGRWVELALGGGLGTLQGPVSVGVAVLPIPRLAVGLGLGWGRYPHDEGNLEMRQQLRLVLFGRGYLVERPRWRLAVGLATASVDDGVSHGGTAEDGQSVTVYRTWQGARRVDGALALELPRGNLALRIEAGVGRVFGGAGCQVRYASGVGTRCEGWPDEGLPAVRDPEPTRWRPFVGVALAVRPGGARLSTTVKEALGETRPKHLLDLVATGTALRGTDLMNDGHYTDHPDFDAGIDAQYLHRLGRGGWRLGVGSRWSFGTGRSFAGEWEYEHVLSLPLLVGWAWQSQVTGEEVEVVGGAGPGLFLFSEGSNGNGVMSGAGLAIELGVNYVRPVGSHLAVVVGFAVRAQSIAVDGPADSYYLDHASGFHGEIPLRIGLRYRR